MTPNKEKELRNHLKTLDKDQLIELLLQFKCDAELLQDCQNILLMQIDEKLVLEKALQLACVPRDDWNCKEPKRIKYTSNYDYFIDQARESLKNDK